MLGCSLDNQVFSASRSCILLNDNRQRRAMLRSTTFQVAVWVGRRPLYAGLSFNLVLLLLAVVLEKRLLCCIL